MSRPHLETSGAADEPAAAVDHVVNQGGASESDLADAPAAAAPIVPAGLAGIDQYAAAAASAVADLAAAAEAALVEARDKEDKRAKEAHDAGYGEALDGATTAVQAWPGAVRALTELAARQQRPEREQSW